MVGVEELRNVLRGQVGEVVHGFPTVKQTDKQLGKVVQVVVYFDFRKKTQTEYGR